MIEVSDTPKYFITAPKAGHGGFVANAIYEIKLRNLDFIPSDECVELKFFSPEESRKENIFPNMEVFLAVFDPKLHK
ncbi:MAG: 8-oxo-dGTP diphosphatase [Patescibacteria group bacterium]|nr:hypothetical protein [Candidatus Saccharibacteria bacterium]MDQ5963143.1 8-oxo-dGTP diphosphatase [Patescibacteria group bacterium]